MDPVTGDQCKAVVEAAGLTYLGHHRCCACGSMVGYYFAKEGDELKLGFDPNCDCGFGWTPPQRRTWSDLAEEFNMQTPEVRAVMWERFKQGKATHEDD